MYDPRYEHDACGLGFVVNIKGNPAHQIIADGLTILENLVHRGAEGAEPNTGDGAGVLMQLPDAFLREACAELGFKLPPLGRYGVGVIFLPQENEQRAACERRLEQIVHEEGQQVLGWRTVPVDNVALGSIAVASEPIIRQFFVTFDAPSIVFRQRDEGRLALERILYVIRKRAENEIRPNCPDFYIASFSSRTLVYKGMLLAEQVRGYFPDLSDVRMQSALCMVHSRFSTNTFPSWPRAHPNRYIMHNGEINTIRGNVNWMNARQMLIETDKFGRDFKRILPIIDEDGSDSSMFDNALEFMVLSGYSLAHAMMMMVPEPWSKHRHMSETKQAFYEYHSCIMEPWDGPAAIGFTDGEQIGATLDRNGLRPARYYVTKDDRVIMASEVGVLDVPPEMVLEKGRLQPGRMLLVDTDQGRIIGDDELKETIAQEQPYGAWLAANLKTLDTIQTKPATAVQGQDADQPFALDADLNKLQHAFGYTFEELRVVLAPMAANGKEAIGSMGNDTPPAVLSNRPKLLYEYFKQLFAQVTNPPIDAIREELITATETFLGTDGDLLHPQANNAHRVKLKHPILSNSDLTKLRHIDEPGFKSATLPLLFDAGGDGAALTAALETLFAQADAAIADAANILILSDRGVSRSQAPIPVLLAVAGLHHHLIRNGSRVKVSLVVESAEPREVHHIAVLLGYGVEAINPYLAFACIGDLLNKQLLTDIAYDKAVANYTKALVTGVVKVCSKMGISTIQSYTGAQIFEALGLHKSVVAPYFTGTATRIGGSDIDVLAREVHQRHTQAFPARPANGHVLPVGGNYQWRQEGEKHGYNPMTVHALQRAVRSEDYDAFKRYSADVNDDEKQRFTLRGLLKLQKSAEPIPLSEVESVDSIVRRFKTGAMSYGSISQEAHEALALGMNRLGAKSNTGEGGEDPGRFIVHFNGDSRRSAIKQVASGRFGVTSEYLVNADEIQIKMAQGAKPGEGGQLPGKKVYPWIAKVRHSTPGVGLISPPPHHDIYSIEDLKQLIFDLKNANPTARINVKLVSEVGVGTIAAGVTKAHADVILISGYSGGTGASPLTSLKHAGLPWELGLAETHQTLLLNNLRTRVRLETDGQLKTGRDVVIAALLGAEEYGFSTAPLITLGCIMMRVCHMNTCPVGVATQDPRLRAKFTGKPEHVITFMRFIAEEMREIMAKLGVRTVNELIGRTDLLEPTQAVDHWKASGIDLSNLLYQPDLPAGARRYQYISQDHGLQDTLDYEQLIDICEPALNLEQPVSVSLPISNRNRTVGTMLGSVISREYGSAGLPENSIRLTFKGSAGQSFGAFLPHGVMMTLEGDANDYFGKGLSGGKLAVYPPEGSTFVPEDNIIIGNVALYGATGGKAYIRGMAGERFCVRNSGVEAVVEAVGDHGCEYMTGGRVVVLGKTGRNFAAGMSGGVAYVLDEDGEFYTRCNTAMVDLETVTEPSEIEALKAMITRHYTYTNSERAWRVLARWEKFRPKFVKVMPTDYKRMLDEIENAHEAGHSGDEALLIAFENKLSQPA
ncbi:MAG: glutamate synthase large subunit [Anaerolineae bacterium]|nr:glutamate synthase large subunit [Anaerolineae bacterium]